jgi:hypothetical protein
MYVLVFISPIYLSVIFSNSLAVRSHSPSDNGFIVVKQYKLGQVGPGLVVYQYC